MKGLSQVRGTLHWVRIGKGQAGGGSWREEQLVGDSANGTIAFEFDRRLKLGNVRFHVSGRSPIRRGAWRRGRACGHGGAGFGTVDRHMRGGTGIGLEGPAARVSSHQPV